MKKPNIVLISIDTLRADHLSCYGYRKATTPNIDKIAAEGTIYYQNYSAGVWTPPGHASMLTGLYLNEHGVYDDRRLSDSIPTIATVLKESGYRTSGFVNNSQVGELVGFSKGHEVFEEVWKGIGSTAIVKRIVHGVKRIITDRLGYSDMGAARTNHLFKKWLENRGNKDKPFYSFLHYIEPHNPLNPPRPFKKRFLDTSNKNIDMEKITKIAYNPLICFVENLNASPQEIGYLKGLYDGEIAYTDSMIGKITSILKSRNVYDDTMIIITSDHGEHFGEYGLWSHVASLHKEVLHVPLIIKYPRGIEHVKEVNELTQSVDIFPTIMDVTGLSREKLNHVSGISLVQNKTNDSTHHEYIFAEWEGRIPYFILEKSKNTKTNLDLEQFRVQMSMIQDRQYKYIMKSDGTEELYDISSGKDEIQDRGANGEIKERLQGQLLSRKEMERKLEGEKKNYAIDDEIAENLRFLGYM